MSQSDALDAEPAVSFKVAVTGHRDLLDEDLAPKSALRDRLRRCLQELADTQGDTPLLLLSGLAEGADRLVAGIALEMGVEVVACLPKPRDAYEQDFVSESSVQEFRGLIARCRRTILIPPPDGSETVSNAASRPYVALGAFLVRHADVLVALWDGKEAGGPGGTAHVVALMQGRLLHIPVIRRGVH